MGDMDVSKHPLVSRLLLKGTFHARPPLPHYTRTWNVQVVLNCMQQWVDTTSLSLKLLSFRLVMLLCLARPSRSEDLASLCIDKCQFKPQGVLFLPSELSKQSRQGKPLTDYFFASFLILSSSVEWKLYGSICKWQKHWGRTPLISLLQLLNLTNQ